MNEQDSVKKELNRLTEEVKNMTTEEYLELNKKAMVMEEINMMKRYKMTKLSKSETPEFDSGTPETRQHRGWGKDLSTPVNMVAEGFGGIPCVGQPYFLFNVCIKDVENHGNSLVTSKVEKVITEDFGFTLETQNSIYKLEEL
jgi:hypothetical protein